MTATTKPGFPCRISLEDAEVGERVVLVHYEHHAANSPFRASHAIFVRENRQQAQLQVDKVPVMFRSRMLSLRGFDQAGMMRAADLTEGTLLEPAIQKIFDNSEVAFIHIHFAKPGCYAARVSRV